MWKDPIVAETRALRDEYTRQFNYDADAIFEDLMAKQTTHLDRVISLPPRKVSPVAPISASVIAGYGIRAITLR